ncbi:RING finger protein 37 [Coemansia sp. BCRC 34301]|nr:RING finger protein 37 [Coemansia sp. BCRC 34301]
MSTVVTSNIELFDYADTRLGITIDSTSPSTDNYEASNLIAKHTSALGFMASAFVKPPVDLEFRLPHTITLACILVDPRMRQSSAKSISIYVMNSWHKWMLIGRMTWDNEQNMPCALHNSDLTPQVVSQTAGRQASNFLGAGGPRVIWQAIGPPPRSLLAVSGIRVRISAMHQAHALGFSRIEIWAQPSQRLPTEQRAQAWMDIRRQTQWQRVASPDENGLQIEVGDDDDDEKCPQEFVDPITLNVMQDPVILPSNLRCDRSTIVRHLGRSKTDPFTGLALDIDSVKPDLLLQQRIRSWNKK